MSQPSHSQSANYPRQSHSVYISNPAMESSGPGRSPEIAGLTDDQVDGPAFGQELRRWLYCGLCTVMAAVVHILDYFVSPRVILTHVIAGALFFSLTKQGVELVPVIQTAILQEVVTYLLWLAVPNSLGTIVSIYACVYLYELLLGPKVTTRQNAILLTEDDVKRTLEDTTPRLHFDITPDGAQFRISTFLRYIIYTRSSSAENDDHYVDGIPLDEVGTIQKGYDLEISRAIRAENANQNTCFYVSLEDNHTTITFISRDTESRDTWVTVLRQLCGAHIGDIRILWLERACKEAGIGADNGMVHPDQLGRILIKAQRTTERAYLMEVLKAQNKAAKNNDNIAEAHGLAKLFDTLTFKAEIEIVYQRSLQKSDAKTVLKARSLWKFVREEQKETASDLITVRTLMRKHETVLPSVYMTSVGFTNYMMSEQNSIFKYTCTQEVYQDMDQPLSHYFINTSHNTYLTKDQLKSKSSVEMYINALKRGCRCVELDTWDGPNNEPMIYHGHTLTSKILLRDVITAVRDHAFTVSEYPVILSFENHCSVEQQKVIATHLINILGDKLYTSPMAEDQTCYPSPHSLRGYVIVKYKKLRSGQADGAPEEDDSSDEESSDEASDVLPEDEPEIIDLEEEAAKKKGSARNLLELVKGVKIKKRGDKKKGEGPKIAKELSDLVIYCQSVRFKGFDHAKERDAFYEMSSLGEKKAVKLAREECCAFTAYNSRQLTRVYPAGGRVDSSNYDPHPLWNVGCQMVALNFQTQDRAMQLNHGKFQDNGGCGYVLKPRFLRHDNAIFDARGPFAEWSRIRIQVISGHQLPYSSEKQVKSERALQVLVRISGVENDCNKDKTKVVKNNGFHVLWQDTMSFQVCVSELAMVQFVVRDGDSFLGQNTVPLDCVQQGYRNIPLLTKASVPIPNTCLFVHIDKGEPKPTGTAIFAQLSP